MEDNVRIGQHTSTTAPRYLSEGYALICRLCWKILDDVGAASVVIVSLAGALSISQLLSY